MQILTQTVIGSIKAFAELEELIVNIEKVAKTGNLEALSTAFFALGEAIKGADFSQISEAMVVSARSGVRGAEAIKDLAGAALVLSEVSLDISPTEATEGLAALTLNLDLSIEKTDELANQIDVLSDTTLSTSGEILKTSARLSGFADALGISAAEVTGLSAALLATKQSATTVRTTLTSLFEVLTSRPFEAAEAVGFTGTAIREFANLTRTDATEAVLVFVEAFSKLDFSEQTNTLKQLEIGSKRISQVMRTFAANTDKARTAITNSTEASNNAANITSKLALANQTTAARLSELDKKWSTFKANLITSGPVMDTIIGLLDRLAALVDKFTIDILIPGDTVEDLNNQITNLSDELNNLEKTRAEFDKGFNSTTDFLGMDRAKIEGEISRKGSLRNNLINTRNELQKAQKEIPEVDKKVSPQAQAILDSIEATRLVEKMKPFNAAMEDAANAVKDFEIDPLNRRIQSVVDQVAEVGEAFREAQGPVLESAIAMAGVKAAAMRQIKAIKDETAEREASKKDKADKAHASNLGKFAGEFGTVVGTLSSVSKSLKGFAPGDSAGRKALLDSAFAGLFGTGKSSTAAPKIGSLDDLSRELQLGKQTSDKDKLTKEQLILAKRMVKLMEFSDTDRKKTNTILEKIMEGELILK